MNLISSLLGGIWGYVAIAVVSLGIGASGAWKVKDGIEAEQQVKADRALLSTANAMAVGAQNEAKRAIQHTQDAAVITEDIDLAAASAQVKINTVTVHDIERIPVYVTPETDSKFSLPCGFIRLHDAAAQGIDLTADPDTVSNPTGKSDGDACEIATSQASAIITYNYGLANTWREYIISWQQWYLREQALWDKEP